MNPAEIIALITTLEPLVAQLSASVISASQGNPVTQADIDNADKARQITRQLMDATLAGKTDGN